MRSLLIVLTLAASLASAQTAPAPATQGDIIQQERAEHRQFFDRDTYGYQPLAIDSIGDLLKLSLDEGGFLKVTYTAAAPSASVILSVRDWPGLAMLSFVPANEPARSLRHLDLDVPDTILRQIEVLNTATHTQLALSIETPQSLETVSLVQNFGLGDDLSKLTLYVNIGVEDAEPKRIEVSANSFRTLLQKDPTTVAAYLLPILAELHGTPLVLDPLQAMGLQVYAPQMKSDPDSSQRISALMRSLDSDEFSERERAKKSLATIAAKDLPALLQFDSRGLSAEAHASIDAAIGSVAPLASDRAAQLVNDPHFALTLLTTDDLELRRIAAAQYRKLTGVDAAVDINAPAMVRLQQVETFRRDLAAATQPGLLNR